MALKLVNLKPYIKNATVIVFLFGVLCSLGCEARPRLRMGSYFGSFTEMGFPDPNELGNHYYNSGIYNEKVGMLYTCKAGFIDVGHMRESADRTRYVYLLAKKNLTKQKGTFKFKLVDPAIYRVTVKYPYDWENIKDDHIIEDVSLHLAQYIGHRSTIWHEIITWFHFKTAGIFSENISSFSWEDPYSDLLGTYVAAEALRDKRYKYDKAVAIAIDERIRVLDPQPWKTAERAKKMITGKWFEGEFYFFVKMQKRNFDVGIDDGFVTPWLVPGICENSGSLLLAAPEFGRFQRYGLKINVEILPMEFEKGQILKIVSPDKKKKTIKPEQDFETIINEIKRQAVELYGDKVEVPEL